MEETGSSATTCRGSVRLQGGSRFTYLLTPVTFDRDYSALQIIHQQGSIIIEAESESRRTERELGRHADVVFNDTANTHKPQTFNLVPISS